MPPEEALDDDYVITLLKKDADAHRKRDAQGSVGSLRRPSKAPKPNTRFLRHIIRETDHHNAVLRAKEEEESRSRLRQHTGSKRKREEDSEEQSQRRKGREGERKGRWASALGGLVGGHKTRPDKKSDDACSHTKSRHRRSHQREKCSDEVLGHGSNALLDPRSTSSHHRTVPRRRTSGSPDDQVNQSLSTAVSEPDSSEDLGPSPPSTSLPRGRGAHKPSSIERRFHPGYDPATDVGLEQNTGESADWDLALEALRDRAKWKANAADRLQAAGFSKEEISRWSKGKDNAEKGVEDVIWRKKGEAREWDRGKVVGDDGSVGVEVAWTK